MQRTALSVFLLLLAAGAFWVWPSEKTSGTDAERRTAKVQRREIEQTVVATGVIRPRVGAEVQVGSQVSGLVTRLAVEVGDRVEVGDLLATLDDRPFVAVLDQATARADAARTRIEASRAALERRRRLFDEGLLAAEALEVAERDLRVEEAEEISARAAVRAARLDLDQTRIRAPIRGIVADVSTREGETVAAAFAAPNFVTLLDLDRLEVHAYVDETDIGRIEVGQSASFGVDTYRDLRIPAEVVAIEPQAELQGSVVNYVVRLAFAPPDDALPSDAILRPEMTAHVRFVVAQRIGVVTVPQEAVGRREGKPFVVVRRVDQWTPQEVRTGALLERRVEILSGVSEGESIALDPDETELGSR